MQGNSAQDVCLSDDTFDILLLQVVPGKEASVIKALRENLKVPVNIYLGFGRYDVIIVHKRSEAPLVNLYQAVAFNSVVDCFPISGIQWQREGSARSSLSDKKPFFGLSLIKLNPQCTKSDGDGPAKVELNLVLKLLNLGVIVCCSLGNYECVCLSQTESIKDLSSRILAIKEVLCGEPQSCYDITTIPSVSSDFLEPSEKSSLQKCENLAERVEVYTFLCLGIGPSEGLTKLIEDPKVFENCKVTVKSIFGFHDVIIHCSGPLGNIANGILAIREKSQDIDVHSTYATIVHVDGTFPFLPRNRDMVPITQIQAKAELSLEAVAHFARLVNMGREDFLTADLFRDHGGLFERAIMLDGIIQEHYKNGEMKEYRDILGDFDSLMGCMRQSFSQRLSCLAPGNLLAHKSLSLEPHGSIQRAILALESIPLSVSGKLGRLWSGFCSYGYTHKFYWAEGGIINTPYEYRTHPERWWGIFHELGHDFHNHLPMELLAEIGDIVNSMADEVFQRMRGAGIEITQESYREAYSDFSQEIFAEMFGYFVGFHSRWDIYLEKVWGYFADEFPIDASHVARSLLVRLTLGPDQDSRSVDITDDYLTNCISDIEKIIANRRGLRIDPSEKRRAKVYVMSFIEVADKFAKWFSGRPQLVKYDEKDGADITTTLMKGIPVFKDNPLEVVYSLTEYRGSISERMRFAAILSLHNSYWKTIHEVATMLRRKASTSC